MDNFGIVVRTEGEKHLRTLLSLFDSGPGVAHPAFTHYMLTRRGMVLYGYRVSSPEGATPLPTPMDSAGAARFVHNWLEQMPEDEFHLYARAIEEEGRPDEIGSWNEDGDVKTSRGFVLFTDKWGHVDGVPQNYSTLCCVCPAAALSGK